MANIDRYRAPRDLPARLPVFPLRGAILLPRSELPLNVFEPRYLQMVEDALVTHRIIGIVQPGETMPLSDSASLESPSGKAGPLKRIGCAGRITAYQELPDGRLRIVLSGIARFAIASEAPTDKPYRLANTDFAEFDCDFADDSTADAVDRAELMRVLKSYLASRQLDADWSAIARAPLEPLVNGLASMSPFQPEEKQALLEARTLQDRAAVLVTLAQMAIAGGTATDGGNTLQ